MRIRKVNLWECDDWKEFTRRSEREVESAIKAVAKIVLEVKKKGDKALIRLTKKLDGADLERSGLSVEPTEIEEAVSKVDAKTKRAIKRAAENIEKFHRRNLPKGWFSRIGRGIRAGQVLRPLEEVGVYVPGGLARYPSTLLMAAIPAKVAGVNEIVVCTPPDREGKINPTTACAAIEAGVKKIFKVGGAQAIAAMAYGTESIPKVDKIVGPGNIYVSAAKYLVSKDVEVEFIAGPSEVLIIADVNANAQTIAADMIAQAEHDPEAAAVLVTTSRELAESVAKLLQEMVGGLERGEIIRKSLEKYGLIAVAKDVEEAVRFANEYAPEHLEIITKNPKKILPLIKHAGSIFMGQYSPVAAGDFITGPNHILPTGGLARCRSGLSALDFIRFPTVQELTKKALLDLLDDIEAIAEAEGLPAHAKSVRTRLEEDNGD